ncbi:nitrile hydratase accessory protein [Caulobacter sp. KR2-114]|uniref:nitrile hydratase accessory protein n=1 Tax=Caulobacter sp. KR2-114 TaxID=3400912 RepID=UPI003C0A56D8
MTLHDSTLAVDATARPEVAFEVPWQAQAFALVLALHEQGAFSWPQWAEGLGRALRQRTDDSADGYYEAWLAALETIVCGQGLSSPSALAERKEAWAEAYLRTPHGKPVAL